MTKIGIFAAEALSLADQNPLQPVFRALALAASQNTSRNSFPFIHSHASGRAPTYQQGA